MDLNNITQIIGSLGFPIVACIAMFMQMTKQVENHKTEMDRITEALNNNTVALTKLAERIGKENED